MRAAALLALATLPAAHVLGACIGMNAADEGTCPAGRCVSVAVSFRNPSSLAAVASHPADQAANATFVAAAGMGRASRESGRLTLSLEKPANGTGYVGTTVYFSRWIHYGVVSAMIRSGSTAPGVVSSFQLQSADGSSIDMDWVGASSDRVQANYYTRNQIDLARAAAPVLAANPTSSFIEYKIVWLPDALTWYANGLAVRTVRRQDTWSEGEQAFNFPSSPARLSFAIWDASTAADPGRMQQWAGARRPGDETRFTMAIESVSVQCYANLVADAHRPPHRGEDAPPAASAQRLADTAPSTSAPTSDLGSFGLTSKEAAGDASAGTAAPASPQLGDDVSKWLASMQLSHGSRRPAGVGAVGAALVAGSLAAVGLW
ncbi:putative glycosidase CRH2 [Coemansia spiralis]|nr:putative glycosidase CRH2 [Coemansia spiralis]